MMFCFYLGCHKIISIIALAIKLSYFCSRSVAMSCPNYFGKIYAWPKTEIPEVDRLFVYIEFKVATSSSLFKVAVSHWTLQIVKRFLKTLKYPPTSPSVLSFSWSLWVAVVQICSILFSVSSFYFQFLPCVYTGTFGVWHEIIMMLKGTIRLFQTI